MTRVSVRRRHWCNIWAHVSFSRFSSSWLDQNEDEEDLYEQTKVEEAKKKEKGKEAKKKEKGTLKATFIHPFENYMHTSSSFFSCVPFYHRPCIHSCHPGCPSSRIWHFDVKAIKQRSENSTKRSKSSKGGVKEEPDGFLVCFSNFRKKFSVKRYGEKAFVAWAKHRAQRHCSDIPLSSVRLFELCERD